jgi:8-oxo-dGTP diphosphatase
MKQKSPRLTVDGAIIQKDKILLIKRKNEPFKGKWALPGGFVEYGEKVESAITREVLEETGLKTEIKKVIGIYSDPERDPRGHTVTIAYLLDVISGMLENGDDAMDAEFFDLSNLPELSFDHSDIIKDVVRGRD